MALGRHIVRELELADSTDTLGRWLAHELAELITRVESAASEAERDHARQEAAQIIGGLWRRRSTSLGRIYPLAPFRHMLGTITLLRPTDVKHWWRATPADRHLIAVFQAFARLMSAQLLSRVPPTAAPPPTSGAVYDALSSDEQAVATEIATWMEGGERDADAFSPARYMSALMATVPPVPRDDATTTEREPPGDAGESLPAGEKGAGDARTFDVLRPDVAPDSSESVGQTPAVNTAVAGDTGDAQPDAPSDVASASSPDPSLALIDTLQARLTTLRAFIEGNQSPVGMRDQRARLLVPRVDPVGPADNVASG